MHRAFAAVPAFAAVFLLALLPACGLSPLRNYKPVAHAGPIERPHVAARVAPRDPDLPARIERQAGEFCPPEADAYFYFFWLVVYVVYGFGWCVVELVNLICEALAEDNPAEEDEAASPPQEPPSSS